MRKLLALALFVFAAFDAHAAIENTIRRGFTVADGGTLHLDGAIGNVRIVTGGTGVAVEVTQRARTSDRDRANELFRDNEVSFQQNGNDVTIHSEREHVSWFNWDHGLSVQWNIRVPDRYNLDVDTSGGNITIDSIDGTVDLRTSGGNIEAVGLIHGPVSVKTSGGNVDLKGVNGDLVARTSGGSIETGDVTGKLEAKTSGGSIAIGRTGADVSARTSGGDIDIEEAHGYIDAQTSGGSIRARFTGQPNGESRLSTSGGDVNVRYANDVRAEIDAHTSGGGIDSEIPMMVMGSQSRGSLKGSINGGGPKITLRTSGGGITLKKM